MKIIDTDKTNLCFVGDIHGALKGIRSMMNVTDLHDVIYVFCGDCGFGFEKREYYTQILNRIDGTAKDFNAVCYFFRGNHDSKEFFEKSSIKKDRFKTITDYTVIRTPNHNILCVGGATSIDRMYRQGINDRYLNDYIRFHQCTLEEAVLKAKKCYWQDEKPVYDEEVLSDLTKKGIFIDIVATHTSPSFAAPLTKEGIRAWIDKDPALENDLNYERLVMDNIYEKLIADGHPLQKWIYGHFHAHNSEYINEVNFVMLDMERHGQYDVLQVF